MSAAALLMIDVTDEVKPLLDTLLQGLGNSTGMHQAIARRAATLVREHLQIIAQTRHKTAHALGATPTGHWGQAVEKVAPQWDADSARISIDHPGMARAVRDIVIRPRAPRQFLALPVIGEAYGRRAYRVRGLVAIVSGNTGVLMMPQKGRDTTYRTRRYSGPNKFTEHEKKGGRFGTVWYVLVRSVTQPRDRTLLPSDEEFGIAAKQGVRDYVDYLTARAGGSAS